MLRTRLSHEKVARVRSVSINKEIKTLAKCKRKASYFFRGTLCITDIPTRFHRFGKRFIIDHYRYLVNKTWRQRGYLQSIVLDCFVFNTNCFFGLTQYHKQNSLSVTKTIKEILYTHLRCHINCIIFLKKIRLYWHILGKVLETEFY